MLIARFSVVAQVAVNKMTSQNLGVVFGPTLLRTNDSGSEFRDLNLRARIVELCVENAPSLWQ